MGKPAAKKGDLCLHGGKIITGSPDTTTCDKLSARIGDQHTCKSHPPGSPPWPPGPIVTGSSTVFINRLKAARLRDELQCGAAGPGPPGTANPQVESYRVRPEDSYQRLMKGEHEIAERDKVSDVDEPEKGVAGTSDDPVGVSDAKAPPRAAHKSAPSGKGVQYKSKGGPKNPHAKQAGQSKKNIQAKRLGSDVEQPNMAIEAGAGSVSLGVVVKRQSSKEEGGKFAVTYDEQKQRLSVKIKLLFTMDLSVGRRSTSARAGTPMDVIVAPPCSVIIG